MIYMEPQTLGWRPVVKSWLHTSPATLTDIHKSTINDMFERFVDATIQLVRKGGLKVIFLFPCYIYKIYISCLLFVKRN